MTIIKTADLRDFSQVIAVPIPGSTMPVEVIQIHTWKNGTNLMIVKFPPGWSRPITGSYLGAEEFFVFEGEIQMSGDSFKSGDHVWVPPRSLRMETQTPRGAIALAWFYGKVEWITHDESEGVISQKKTHVANIKSGEIRTKNADGIIGRTYKIGEGLFTPEVECEILNVESRTWKLISAGETISLSDQDLVRLSK